MIELTLMAITWRVAARAIDPAPLPLVAQLTVEGSSGGAVTARAVASLSVRRRVVRIDGGIQRMGNRERISYSLVGFDFDDDRLAPGDEAMLRKLAGMTRPGAVVTITGQTDRIGDQARNLTLSTARARNAAAVVRSAVPPGVKVEEMGVGMETTRFSNDTPEGRMLSRGVRVVIEQDAEGGPLSDGLPR